jgi:hypothetical protein
VRKALCLFLFCLAVNLSAQSVTISEQKLNELTQILTQYVSITNDLKASVDVLNSTLADSKKRTDDLQSGFDQYKQSTDALLKRVDLDEKIILWGGGGLLAVIVVETIILLVNH